VDGFLVAFLVGLSGGLANLLVDIPALWNYDWNCSFPATVTFLKLHIGISTLQFSVSSFLTLIGSSLLHLYMDPEDPDESEVI